MPCSETPSVTRWKCIIIQLQPCSGVITIRDQLTPNETICHMYLHLRWITILQFIKRPCFKLQLQCCFFRHLLFVRLESGKTLQRRRMKLYYDIIVDYPWTRWLSQDIMADRIIRGTVAWLYVFADTCLSVRGLSHYDISTTRKQPHDAKIDSQSSCKY